MCWPCQVNSTTMALVTVTFTSHWYLSVSCGPNTSVAGIGTVMVSKRGFFVWNYVGGILVNGSGSSDFLRSKSELTAFLSLFFLMGCCNMEIPVPWKDDVAVVVQDLLSMLSITVVVNNTFCSTYLLTEASPNWAPNSSTVIQYSVIGDAEDMLKQHFYQTSLPGFGKDRESHVH